MANPKLTLTATTAAVEGGSNGIYTITLDTAVPVGGLTVNYNTAGSTATLGTDYSFLAGTNITAVTANSFTIAASATTAILQLVASVEAVEFLVSLPDYKQRTLWS